MHTAAPKALFPLRALPALGAVGTEVPGEVCDPVGIKVVGTLPVSEGAVVLSGEESDEDGDDDEVDGDVV